MAAAAAEPLISPVNYLPSKGLTESPSAAAALSPSAPTYLSSPALPPTVSSADLVEILRIMIRINRWLALRLGDANRQGIPHLAIAARRAERLSCGPLAAFCADMEAVAEAERVRPDEGVITAARGRAVEWRGRWTEDAGEVVRWGWLARRLAEVQVGSGPPAAAGGKSIGLDARRAGMVPTDLDRVVLSDPISFPSQRSDPLPGRALADELGSMMGSEEGTRSSVGSPLPESYPLQSAEAKSPPAMRLPL